MTDFGKFAAWLACEKKSVRCSQKARGGPWRLTQTLRHHVVFEELARKIMIQVRGSVSAPSGRGQSMSASCSQAMAGWSGTAVTQAPRRCSGYRAEQNGIELQVHLKPEPLHRDNDQNNRWSKWNGLGTSLQRGRSQSSTLSCCFFSLKGVSRGV